MNYGLKHGQALIIVGPEGSGKTLLARQIANQYGHFKEVDPHKVFTSYFGLGEAMAGNPKTLIMNVEGSLSVEIVNRLKELICSPEIAVDRRGQMPTIMQTPFFIFTVQSNDDKLVIDFLARRFEVIRTEKRG